MAHMVNAMDRVLRDCIPDITMPFLDDIPIKGCPKDAKDKSISTDWCRVGEWGGRQCGRDHTTFCSKGRTCVWEM